MRNELVLSHLNLPVGSLDAYIHRVNNAPMLTAEVEQELARRFQEKEDIDAAREMVLAHLRYVVRVARGYMGYGLPLGDLIQEGNVGLMKAVKRFDPTIGVRLVSFAVHWIKAEIHEYVLRNWRIVKVATTKAQRKLFFNLRSMKKRLGWSSQAEVNQIADDLGVSAKEVMRMEQRLNAMDTAFDSEPNEEEQSSYYRMPSKALVDENSDPAMLVEKAAMADLGQAKLIEAMKALDPRSLDILQQRWLSDDKATLQDLALKHDISAERVRQLEQNAMKKMKALMS